MGHWRLTMLLQVLFLQGAAAPRLHGLTPKTDNKGRMPAAMSSVLAVIFVAFVAVLMLRGADAMNSGGNKQDHSGGAKRKEHPAGSFPPAGHRPFGANVTNVDGSVTGAPAGGHIMAPPLNLMDPMPSHTTAAHHHSASGLFPSSPGNQAQNMAPYSYNPSVTLHLSPTSQLPPNSGHAHRMPPSAGATQFPPYMHQQQPIYYNDNMPQYRGPYHPSAPGGSTPPSYTYSRYAGPGMPASEIQRPHLPNSGQDWAVTPRGMPPPAPAHHFLNHGMSRQEGACRQTAGPAPPAPPYNAAASTTVAATAPGLAPASYQSPQHQAANNYVLNEEGSMDDFNGNNNPDAPQHGAPPTAEDLEAAAELGLTIQDYLKLCADQHQQHVAQCRQKGKKWQPTDPPSENQVKYLNDMGVMPDAISAMTAADAHEYLNHHTDEFTKFKEAHGGKKPPSGKQKAKIAALGLEVPPEVVTSQDASDFIEHHPSEEDKISDAQRNLLLDRGVLEEQMPVSKSAAFKMIRDILGQQGPAKPDVPASEPQKNLILLLYPAMNIAALAAMTMRQARALITRLKTKNDDPNSAQQKCKGYPGGNRQSRQHDPDDDRDGGRGGAYGSLMGGMHTFESAELRV